MKNEELTFDQLDAVRGGQTTCCCCAPCPTGDGSICCKPRTAAECARLGGTCADPARCG
jgi:hypothetical protein